MNNPKTTEQRDRQRQYSAKYATKNRALINSRRRGTYATDATKRIANTRRARAKRLEMIRALKSAPCMDCGGTFDPICMDFDHRPGEVKLFHVAAQATKRRLDLILAEIAKCDVVCSNCHRIRTYRLRSHSEATKRKHPYPRAA